jgi:hypothetical protein
MDAGPGVPGNHAVCLVSVVSSLGLEPRTHALKVLIHTESKGLSTRAWTRESTTGNTREQVLDPDLDPETQAEDRACGRVGYSPKVPGPMMCHDFWVKSDLQCLQTMACALTFSAQYGHGFSSEATITAIPLAVSTSYEIRDIPRE